MNYSNLSNEQLLDLLKELMSESIKRNITTAAREVLLTEKEKLDIKEGAERRARERAKEDEASRIEREAYQAEMDRINSTKAKELQEKLNRTWALKKEHGMLVKNTIPVTASIVYYVNVWKSNTGEKRVYINDGEPFGKRTKQVACYYVTGNTKNRPGSVEFGWPKQYFNNDENAMNIFKETLKTIGAKWNCVKFSVEEALGND